MKTRAALLGALFVAAGLYGQGAGQPPRPTPAVGMASSAQQPAPEIYQVDLVPSGTGFALSKPVLEGDVYTFIVWPDRDTVRLPKDRVKAITPRFKEMSTLSVWQIDLLPSGRIVAKEEPTLKGTTYTIRTWRDNTLVSMRQTDIKQITHLTGLAAFKVQQEEKGAKLMGGNLPMQGTDEVKVISEPAGSRPPGGQQTGQQGAPSGSGNWIYDGVPGITDGWAPPNAVISSPGDVPKAAPNPPR